MTAENRSFNKPNARPIPDSVDRPAATGARLTSLEAELLDNDVSVDGDLPHGSMARADMAPQAGYPEEGPAPFAGPVFNGSRETLKVYQWEIDPHNASAKGGTANVELDDWEFHIWWQVHPDRLVYASIQAMREDWIDHSGQARAHPVGRSEAVNLVYDLDRKGVVAIYGTVGDFRPFVEAFREGFGISPEGLGSAGDTENNDPVSIPKGDI